MADRKATNKYYPPEWDPSKGSINKFRGQHPLRARARKLESDGILVVRFEMPFHVWCDGCGRVIGKGVRFNAEKSENGKYFTSSIWKFSMKCGECSQRIILQTDPQNADFVVISGAKKKTVEYDETEAGIESFVSAEERERIAADPLLALETSVVNKTKADVDRQRVKDLQEASQALKDDFELSMAARSQMRKTKAAEKALVEEAKSKGLRIALLPKAEEDADEAKDLLQSKSKSSTAKQVQLRKRKDIARQSIFDNKKRKKSISVGHLNLPTSLSSSSTSLPKVKIRTQQSSKSGLLDSSYNSSEEE
jgi:coiled-coil domain-containing protein 130